AALLTILASLVSGQTPVPVPTGQTRNFGNSLEQYKNRNKKDPEKKSGQPADEETIRVRTDLVINDVLVTDQNGRIISGLTKDDFSVREDDAPPPIEIFSAGENASLPRAVVLILDFGAVQIPFYDNSIEAAKRLVDKLNPKDKMAIVTNDVKLQL